MKLMNPKNPVMASWMQELGHRLDAPPFLSGAIEARKTLDRLSVRKDRLAQITEDGLAGIFHAGRIPRIWVDDRKHGVPFLSSTDILQADISRLSLISNRVVEANPKLIIQSGWMLITRSGRIGRTAYARSEMDQMACTEDVLRVVPNESAIPGGYLYAFLSSRFGLPIVTSGTYGAIIQHIEPEHIADLPVPRFGKRLEQRVHDLVVRAGEKRTSASALIANAKSELLNHFGRLRSTIRTDSRRPMTSVVSSLDVANNSRLEGFFYNPIAKDVDEWVASHKLGYWTLGEIAKVFDVPLFKHIYVESDQGVPFFPSGDLFLLDRKARHHLSKTQTEGLEKYIIERGWVLLARSGQLGGIIGRPQFTDSALHNCATSDHVIRIVPMNSETIPPGFLFAFLDLHKIGYPLITRTIAGKSVPALWPRYLDRIKILKATPSVRQSVHEQIVKAFEMRVEATGMEDKARGIVENAIEEDA